MGTVTALLGGLVFGLGLIAGGMANPSKVKAFLDLAGAWDPSLALVMGGAIAVALPAFALARRRRVAWSGEPMDIPTATHIDARLVGGGILFGIGWGVGGFCPGPIRPMRSPRMMVVVKSSTMTRSPKAKCRSRAWTCAARLRWRRAIWRSMRCR